LKKLTSLSLSRNPIEIKVCPIKPVNVCSF